MAIISFISKRFQVLFLSFCFFLLVSPGCAISFNFDFAKNEYSNVNCTRDASERQDYHCKDLATTGLTKDSQLGSNGSIGIAFYSQPVPLWDNTTGEVTCFDTTFSFQIRNATKDTYTKDVPVVADGLTFFLSAYPPPNNTGGGQALGLFNRDTMYNESANQIVAVEFDTYLNSGVDPPSNNHTDCHIGIDINKINSTVSWLIPQSFFINKNMTAQINYSNLTKNLKLNLSRDDDPAINFNINTTIDLTNILPNEVAVGFTASTGSSVELHLIYSWSFNSTLTVVPKANSNGSINSTLGASTLSRGVKGALIVFAVILFLLATFLYLVVKKRLTGKNGEIEMICDPTMDDEFEKGRGPKKFQYNELTAATKNFAENEKLGEGGFGSVYRGILLDEGTQVAIKRVSKASKQGKKEYISEVKIISQLRHRNLVQLVGWCHDHGELLLVYELMHNGNLDTHLYHKETVMAWPLRHQIALGLGSALLYLHSECQKCVVHRDIKPSNVMLDSSFNAKLGDFGLARLIDHNSAAQTVPAGTYGYMAPEYFNTGQATTESDIYSFGVVLLEISCGRRPVVIHEDQNKVILVKWVWDLYGNDSILDAIDSQLNGEFKAQEAERLLVVGLWCAQPDYALRPSIRQALSVLQFESPLPALPSKMPLTMYANTVDPSDFSYPVSGSTSGIVPLNIGTAGSTATSSKVTTNSLDTTWLFKEEVL
ncbi:hypothetical protein LUZ63_013921 [Rhynchospora breviuscula]|uniref:non-specific serine/threonine protein kinase n=1 Tax=Rhynchospora breviuscula TaxID=2022672 RepID=A0A9Q0C9F5_9POAL|nr:hypothetical protein LUZ63_013921 [Rhynchospora breviuscula]